MATVPIPFDPKIKDMVLEVIKNVRRQEYTPEKLCQLQKILECKYFYWWCMDMKKEEYATELFDDDFEYYNFKPGTKDKKRQALISKWCNKPMQTMHMGHQPMIWLIDDSHARGVFQYEDHMCYFDDTSVVQGWAVYCDDFVKDAEGVWHISRLRMGYREMDGNYKNPNPPEGWIPEDWEEPNY